MSDFSAEDLAITARALASAGQLDARLFSQFEKAADQSMIDFNVHDLVNIAWAFAVSGQCSPSLLPTLVGVVEDQLEDLNAHELANIVWVCIVYVCFGCVPPWVYTQTNTQAKIHLTMRH